GDLVDEALERYTQPRPPALSTGWCDIDEILDGGLRPGQMCVVAARTGIGKTVIGINLAVEAARQGKGSVIASLEMAREEITDRIIAQVAAVELSRLTTHRLDPHDWARVRTAQRQLRDVPLR
ncbi:DnaB-like helicase C-terminal domain-containing protein, partial [Longimycelium tulufanense]|uniref:DnaB-like helicase C-terminal domain-containing protein n=1 Tax=Longimycelium tulufanense TaxID=907463 RepID=UPI001665CD1B